MLPAVSGEILGVPAVVVPLRARREAEGELYPPVTDAVGVGERFTARLVPFGLWGNRGDGAMRVWVPAPDPR
ncbi:hypothetical protein [Nesterenkonia suensis]